MNIHCHLCDHKKNYKGPGHCLMFRINPDSPCLQHTDKDYASLAMQRIITIKAIKSGKFK